MIKKVFFALIAILIIASAGFAVYYFMTQEQERYFTVSVEQSEGGTLTASPDGKVREGEKISVTAIPDTGYETLFLYVNGKQAAFEDGKYTIESIDRDISLSAVFSEINYNYEVIAEGSGDAAFGEKTGDEVTFYARPAAHWLIGSLALDGEEAALFDSQRETGYEGSVTAYSDHELAVVFVPAEYTVTVNDPLFIVSADKTSGIYGDKIVLSADLPEGGKIISVTVNGEEIQGTDGAYTYIIPEYAAGLDIRVVCGLLDGLYLPEVEDGGATVEGLGDVYRAGETLTFTVTGSNYVKIVGVRVNGELLSAEGNTYTYQIPEGSEELVIFVETETLAHKTEGEGDFSVNFSQATQSDVQGTLLLNPELLAPTVIEANFYAPNLPQMVANNIRFGLRMYLLNAEGGGEFTVADVVIARANGSWWLDAGYDLRNTNLPVRQLYKLSTRQIAAAADGQLKILIVKDGASHRVYAQDGDIFEFAVEYVDDDATMVTFDSIVLLVNNSTAAKGIGKFGMHGVCMYSGYHENMDDEALVAMFADSKVGLAVDLKANDAEALGLKASYAAGETLQFTAAAADDLHEIDEVTINGERIDAKEGVYSWTVPEDATALEIKITIKVKDGILIPEVSSGAATVYGLKEYYKAGETVTFSAATDKFHAVTGAIVNGSSITMTAGTFRYVTKETDRTLDIVIQTITLAAEYTGKADIIKNFKDIEPSEDANHLLQGALYSCSDNGNRLPSPSVIVSSLYLEGFEDIRENGTRFGLRIYNRKAGSNTNEFAFDVILARQDDVWCLDMGSNNIIYDKVTPETHYPLSSAQLNALKAGELQIAILQNGSTYSLYALDGNVFEFVESFTCTNGAASVSAIDLVVNNALVALQRSGDHEFGVKDMTVYGDHSTSMDAEEVIDFFLERDVALNATATAGEGVKITGVKNNYMAGETVEFTLTTEKFYEVASVKVNGEEITASGGKYSYTLPADATSVNIEVTTTQTAVVYEGKDNFSKNFNDTKISNTAGQLYNNNDNGGTFLAPAVFDANFYAPQINSIPDNVRFGFRIYLKNAQGGGAFTVADVVIGKTSGNWYLDIGYDLRGTQRNNYRLSNEQIQSVAEGTFKVIVVKNGTEHRLYAQNGDHFEYVASYTDDDATMVSFSTIDLLVHNSEGKGVGEYGVHDMTVYAEYSDTMSDSELLAFLVDGKIGYREYAGKGDDITVKDFSDISSNGLKLVGPIYDKGDHGGIYLDKSMIEAHFTMPSIKSIQGDLNVGFRIYATDHNNTNKGWPDIILGRRDGNWYLNIGNGIGNSVISTAYQLSEWQIDAVEKGDLTILVVNDGIRHALYAIDEGGFEKVKEYSDSNAAMITFKSIDFLAWNGANGTGTCGFTGLTVYGNFDETLSDEELVELFAGSNAE